MLMGAYPFEDPELPKDVRRTIQVTILHFVSYKSSVDEVYLIL